MRQTIHTPPPDERPADRPQQPDLTAASDATQPTVRGRLRDWMERGTRALERAERQIMERFKVPPNGG